jgi:hypothetical protein
MNRPWVNDKFSDTQKMTNREEHYLLAGGAPL